MDRVVEGFVRDARFVLDAIHDEFGGSWRDGIGTMLRAVRTEHRLPREGSLGSGISYSVHGAGCRFTTFDGTVVDLDTHGSDGRVAFDPWRLRNWAESRGLPIPAEADLIHEAAMLVARGELSHGPEGWWFLTVKSLDE